MNEDPTQELPDSALRLILARFDSIDARFDLIDKRLNSLEVRLDSVDTRLVALEDKVDSRLQETRPIWEGVLTQLKEMNVRLSRLEDENKDFRRMFRSAFSDLARIQGDLEERLDKLTGHRVPQ